MDRRLQVGVLLGGCGFYDGSEPQETLFTLLALDKYYCDAICFAPDVPQTSVVNHITGEEMPETRNVLIESARLTRGNIKALAEVDVSGLDALIIPGGFGVVKNFTDRRKHEVRPDVKQLVLSMYDAQKPIAAVCLSPTILVQVLEEVGIKTKLSPKSQNTPEEARDIAKNGLFDSNNRILTSPCYTEEASMAYVYLGVENTIIKLTQFCNS